MCCYAAGSRNLLAFRIHTVFRCFHYNASVTGPRPRGRRGCHYRRFSSSRSQYRCPSPGHPPSPISTPSTSSDESDCPRATKRRLLKRMVKSAPPILSRSRANLREKPLPDLPAAGTSEMRALHTDVCIGFPKRPRYPHQRHPSLDIHASLPDGLYKGRMQLDKHMLPNFDWAGLRVKYFLEISVLFGQDEMRARVPLRIS
ncbi:hypothetical protein A0H81_12637 [Grifola frondosa]|uniref:Uncharacterized protein n=1 Tax=Grifola frondosa TaxID=5627 RepID=A0A1C7LS29_GRIFR|nr:hypothetical protein A0H81_12637 [Grifola frondosa]